MSDENTPPADESASPPAANLDAAEPMPAQASAPLPPITHYVEPAAMADAAAELPAEDVSEAEIEPETHADAEVEANQTGGEQPSPEDEPKTERSAGADEAPTSPKPKRTRKSKSAASGADGPADAPGSTDPNATPASPGDGKKKWYVVKIQSGREDSIKAAIERKVRIEGLEEYFGQIAIPVEEMIVKKSVKVKDKKTGDKVTQEKKVVKHTKKYPGYLFAEVEFNDRILYLFRETSGVGDFVGAGLKREPTPMTEREVTQMLTGVVEPGAKGKGGGNVKVKLDFEKGDKVKIRDGAFANMEGEVKHITEAKETGETPKVTVVVTVFGRPVDVTVDYWHVDKV